MSGQYFTTGSERTFSKHERLVSTTNTKGIITHANEQFVNISGFTSDELMGKPHNIVRHPEMPKAAFAELWQHLKQGKPWMGVICNRCKDGGYYWVDAYVTPLLDDGDVVGFQSVRSKPSAEHIKAASAVYGRIKRKITSPFRLPRLGMTAKLMLAFALAAAPLFAAALVWPSETLPLMLSLLLSSLLALVLAVSFSRPYRLAAEQAKAIFDSDIAREIYTGRTDELGQLQLAIKVQQSELSTILTRIGESASGIDDVSKNTAAAVDQTNQAVHTQQVELESVSTAMNEMSATVEEVAQSTSQTSSAANQVDEQVSSGSHVVDETVTAIELLAHQVSEAVKVIGQLQEDSVAIGSVVGVIRGIAEQTNLLALNAAIEAARAGEQGRGFAVVADEVRTLASQTQTSTEQIQAMIERLQNSSKHAVTVMTAGQEQANVSVEQAGAAGIALQRIGESVSTIKDMCLQIASASEQQSVVAEEINRNIVSISEVSKETSQTSQITASSTEQLMTQVEAMRGLVNQFTH